MKKKLISVKCWIILLYCAGVLTAQETSHFTFTSNTGNNMILLIRTSINPEIDGQALQNGDEIGVFNDEGLCVGAIVWNGANVTITVWGDDDQTDETDGLRPGDTLRVRIWDESESEEYLATVTSQDNNNTYGADLISIAETLTVNTTRINKNEMHTAKKINNSNATVFDIKGRAVKHNQISCKTEGINRKNNLSNGAFIYRHYSKGNTDTYLRTNIR